MKVRNYKEIATTREIDRKAFELVNFSVNQLRKNPKFVEDDGWAEINPIVSLPPIMTCLGSLEGKTILDLGCGSNNPRIEGDIYFSDRQFEPWLCRTLKVLGANPIGMDIGPLAGEEFEHYWTELTQPDSLKIIPDNSIDLVNACQLFDSPFLKKVIKVSGMELKKHLLPQIERVLKPDCYFLYWSGEWFRK
jgi:hypothetical protein